MDVKLQEINDASTTQDAYISFDQRNKNNSKNKPNPGLLTQQPSFGVIPILPDQIHSLQTVEAPQEQQPNLDELMKTVKSHFTTRRRTQIQMAQQTLAEIEEEVAHPKKKRYADNRDIFAKAAQIQKGRNDRLAEKRFSNTYDGGGDQYQST